MNPKETDMSERKKPDDTQSDSAELHYDFGHKPLQAQAQTMGLSYDDVKKGLERLLPFIEMAAKLTENNYDDMAVTFLKQLLGK